MAKAKKCDICGKYYDTNTKFEVSRNGKTCVDGICTTTVNGHYHNIYELCDECLEKLLNFLKLDNYK